MMVCHLRPDTSPAFPARERGATLLTSLLLLLVLTVLGLTAMQMSRMEERMAGNARDAHAAFEGAEAALRNGESLLRQQLARPADCTALPCPATLPVFSIGVLGSVASQPGAWWDPAAGNALPFKDANGNASMNGQKIDPTLVIEHLGFVRTDGAVETGMDAPVGRDFYQITARASGASGAAGAVLQSTYARKF